ncbi:hypothetical protein B0T21DRAFT_346996 [Apiosordaria backusii]|uniref:Uncharacterized protein n=1 Tax=Apiosordaria backusii TaxID=314023 RepID=A0AA40EFI7_9PEZI|nr:hypothetical protein B0T21DRAFT_346996 [Apiosordaria backusii]
MDGVCKLSVMTCGSLLASSTWRGLPVCFSGHRRWVTGAWWEDGRSRFFVIAGPPRVLSSFSDAVRDGHHVNATMHPTAGANLFSKLGERIALSVQFESMPSSSRWRK